MGPKKAAKDTEDENYWRTCIEEAPLDDETWTVKVIIIESAGSDQDRMYLNKFEVFAAEERRFVIKNICKTETIFMVNQLGGEKKVKDENLRVFEEGQSYLKEKRDIPADILALIIKKLILKMKDEYLFIKRQRLEVKEGMRRESNTMISRAEVRGTVIVKPPEPVEPPPETTKGKGKKGEPASPEEPPLDEGKKYNTLLRVRGEEWRDKVYVDDFPIDGPNIYVAVTGFLEPFLALSLIKIGIPLTAVVQIRINPTEVRVPSSLFRASKRGQSQTDVLMDKSLKFWEDLQQLRIQKYSTDFFKNTAFLVFSPPYWNSDNLSGEPERIYDEVCYLLYDIQDLTRQHINYLQNLDTICIPEEERDKRFNNFYSQLTEDIPLECATAYTILDNLLQTVCKMEQLGEDSSQCSLSTAMTLNQTRESPKDADKVDKATNLVNDVFKVLCSTDAKSYSYRISYGEEYENHKNPTIINFGDIAKYNTFHLGNINLDNLVTRMLLGMPLNNLWSKYDYPTGELEAKIQFHVNILLSCFDRTDIESAELNRLLHILAFRKLYNNRSSLKKLHTPVTTLTEFKKTYLKRSILAEPLPKSPSLIRDWSSTTPSFPSMVKSNEGGNVISDMSDEETYRIKFLFDCPDISELVSAAEIANEKPLNHIIDDFEYFEDFSGSCGFQTMTEAFYKYNCVDYKYCEVTDCLIMMFFNSHDSDGISREEWRCHLPTPLCLQDFFDFVLEEQYDWIQGEEKIYDERIALKSESVFKVSNGDIRNKSCIEHTDIQLELLMEGSLKHRDILAAEDLEPEESVVGLSESKKTTKIYSESELETKSSKKAKSPTASTPKATKSMFKTESTIADLPKKPFSGYDLGDRRVEVFGKDSMFFSKDGTRVKTAYSLMIPMNLENISLLIIPGDEDNKFWIHKVLGDSINSTILDTCESFRIVSKNNVIIYVKKQSYEIPLPAVAQNISTENAKPRENTLKSPNPSSKVSNTILQFFETKSFYSLFVTWPNGLITETVHQQNSRDISHIKQYYSDGITRLNEDMRCISLNGEVIIFKKQGNIEVLRPDGSYINITKAEKRLVGPSLEDTVSETSSEKSKKPKSKDKSKEKPSKASSKSSKNAVIDDDVSEIKPPEYVLMIEEFETVDPNGVKERWFQDDSSFIEKLLIQTATDYCLGEVFSKRMDGTNTLLNKDGIQTVTYSNGTRIITKYFLDEDEVYPEWSEEELQFFALIESDTGDNGTIKSKVSDSQKSVNIEQTEYSGSYISGVSKKLEEEENIEKKSRTDGYISVQIMYIIEHPNFTTVTINKANGKITIDSPDNTSISLCNNKDFEIFLDKSTTAVFDSESLNINYKACVDCQSKTTCNVKIKSDEMCSVSQIHRNWLKMEDSFSKKIVVNEEGNISVSTDASSEEDLTGNGVCLNEESVEANKKETTTKSESSFLSQSKCREMYKAKNMRFFVLKRDLTCSELLNRSLVEEYKQECRWQPWCSINRYNTFGDHRSILSILSPVHKTETEKWLMESKLADKPKFLTYKDLKKDCGKGFYHWMRPYGRFEPKPKKPNNVLPDRLPRAYIFRVLEQQWSESKRDELKGGKELLYAILRYRHIIETDSEIILNIPIIDLRPEDERRTDSIIQAIAHRTYEDLKIKLAEDVQSRVKMTITTKPLPAREEMSIEGEVDEVGEATEEFKSSEEGSSILQEVSVAQEMSSNLKRYWRRRAEEYKEEQFYQYLLREGSVPPYFRNVLGGAIWWEMNNAAGEAATTAERRKMKCACPDEENTATDTIPFM